MSRSVLPAAFALSRNGASSALHARFLPLGSGERTALKRFTHPMLRNWNGFEVGALRLTGALA